LCGRNNDLEIGWWARKESHEIRFPDAEVSSGMNVGKELKAELGMKKCLVAEWQSDRHQERPGIRMGGNGLDENENENASKRSAALRRTRMRVNILTQPTRGRGCEETHGRTFVVARTFAVDSSFRITGSLL
jgi:hypothetical protein